MNSRLVVVGVLVAVTVAWALTRQPEFQASEPVLAQKTSPEPRQSQPAIDKSAAIQAKRKALLQKLVDLRIFTKIDMPGNLPRVHVGPAFYALDFDQKQSFVSVVYAYHFDGTNKFDLVRIFDGRTNKPIGTFSASRGLNLD